MKDDLSHLPQRQRDELSRVVDILRDGFAEAISGGTQPWRRQGKILKIILFGSYARDDWVDEPDNGYQSDFDLLIVVSDEKLTDIADFWWAAEDRILRDPTIDRQVNIIVHDLNDVNTALTRGEYFWTDIVRDGVELFALPNHALATPMPLTPRDALEMAEGYFEKQSVLANTWLETFDFQLTKAAASQEYRKVAAFSLHQATETIYACFLLTTTFYFPRSHNIKFLRSLAEDKDQRLIDAWPRTSKAERRRFETLKRAYVEARYSPNYDVSDDDLKLLSQSVRDLQAIVETISRERIAELRDAAAA